jgi:hypothetical protein
MFKKIPYKSGKRDPRQPLPNKLSEVCAEVYGLGGMYSLEPFVDEAIGLTIDALEMVIHCSGNDEGETQKVLEDNIVKLKEAKRFLEDKANKILVDTNYKDPTFEELMNASRGNEGLDLLFDNSEFDEVGEIYRAYLLLEDLPEGKKLSAELQAALALKSEKERSSIARRIAKRIKASLSNLKDQLKRSRLLFRYLVKIKLDSFKNIGAKKLKLSTIARKPLLRPPIYLYPQIQPTAPNNSL